MRSATLFALVASALAAPAPHSNYVVHEKRHALSDHHWSKVAELGADEVIPFRIALKQSNLHMGHDWLMEVSDPESSKYGQHWSAEDIIDAFKPSHDTVKAVHDWLHESGIESSRHRLSEGLNWLEFEATVEEAASLLKAKYHLFEHSDEVTRHVATDSYSVPKHIQDHIDFVSPGVHFDAKTSRGSLKYYGEDGAEIEKRGSPWSPKDKGKGHYGPMPHKQKHHLMPKTANICNDSFVTPYCLQTLYDVPSNLPAVKGNTVGIVEYTPESFLQSDLDLFFSTYVPKAVGEAPVFDSIDGGYLFMNFTEDTAFDYLGEPSLDLQYAMALLYPQNVILYQVGDLAEDYYTSFNNFLDAIDGSYCTFEGGDVSGYDAVYPDPYPGPHSYQGTANCGTYAPAKVISTSYSYDEIDLPPSYEERQCQEYLKLGLMGITFAYSSGDYGVAGVSYNCVAANDTFTDGYSGNFNPTFPATCPYILSVGATQIKNGTTNVAKQVAAGKQVEVAMELYITPDGYVGTDVPLGVSTIGQEVFSSSGGFSNVFPMPSYQKSAVTSYLKKYAPDYPFGTYNNSGTVRGFPDISSNGAWFSIAVDGELSQVFGTSCAAPTVAALLGLINGERIKAGKSTVGFVNPTLYAHPSVLNDITAGANPACGTEGFSAVSGWDPVTGLGTPNFPKLLKLFMSLP